MKLYPMTRFSTLPVLNVVAGGCAQLDWQPPGEPVPVVQKS